jgi:hypothetical protein
VGSNPAGGALLQPETLIKAYNFSHLRHSFGSRCWTLLCAVTVTVWLQYGASFARPEAGTAQAVSALDRAAFSLALLTASEGQARKLHLGVQTAPAQAISLPSILSCAPAALRRAGQADSDSCSLVIAICSLVVGLAARGRTCGPCFFGGCAT